MYFPRMRTVQAPPASGLSTASPTARTCLPAGPLPVSALPAFRVNHQPGPRAGAKPGQMRPPGVAREVKGPAGPQEPQRRHMRVAIRVNRGDSCCHVAGGQARDLFLA
ncbi:MAG: hypothetical protein JWM19_6894 [Actinomycetia bacterium]|jgi:hypothetical protein|nr:hypothetical protein [Actinomycetes bacterium]